jgi:prepilin-type N-terminal cleavage/methylation domain-containing protein
MRQVRSYSRPMRRGLTLIETLLTLAIIGLVLGIALPRFGLVRDQLAVDQEAGRIVAAHRRARITAILESRQVVLTVSPSLLAIAESLPGQDWRSPGPAEAGVNLEGGTRQVTFSPVGITTGVSNASFRLSRGAARRTVILSRLGRARVQK